MGYVRSNSHEQKIWEGNNMKNRFDKMLHELRVKGYYGTRIYCYCVRNGYEIYRIRWEYLGTTAALNASNWELVRYMLG